MSKAFTKESDGEEEELEAPEALPAGLKNYMTPTGFAQLRAELQHLQHVERPKVVEIVRWAAGNGDRSENGDYLYGKKRLREIDKRSRYLGKRLETAEVVDPKLQQGFEQVFFGATVTYADEDDKEHTVTIVGIDEADVNQKKISWISPLAKALMKSKIGDTAQVRAPGGVQSIEIVDIQYIVVTN